MRVALVENGIVENIVAVVDIADAEIIFPGLEAYVELADTTPCNPGWTWDGGSDFSDDGADPPQAQIKIADPPVNGRVLHVAYWTTYDPDQPYAPGTNPSGLAKTEDLTWDGNRVISKLTQEYDGKGNATAARTELYSTTPDGATIVQEG